MFADGRCFGCAASPVRVREGDGTRTRCFAEGCCPKEQGRLFAARLGGVVAPGDRARRASERAPRAVTGTARPRARWGEAESRLSDCRSPSPSTKRAAAVEVTLTEGAHRASHVGGAAGALGAGVGRACRVPEGCELQQQPAGRGARPRRGLRSHRGAGRRSGRQLVQLHSFSFRAELRRAGQCGVGLPRSRSPSCDLVIIREPRALVRAPSGLASA